MLIFQNPYLCVGSLHRKELDHCIQIILCKRLLGAGRKVLDVDDAISNLIASDNRKERNEFLVSIVKLLLEFGLLRLDFT